MIFSELGTNSAEPPQLAAALRIETQCRRTARHPSGRPGPLKIEPADPAVAVEHLSDQVQAGDQLRFHRTEIDLFQRNPAGCHFGKVPPRSRTTGKRNRVRAVTSRSRRARGTCAQACCGSLRRDDTQPRHSAPVRVPRAPSARIGEDSGRPAQETIPASDPHSGRAEKVSIDFRRLTPRSGQTPESTGIHHDRPADPEMRPEQTPHPPINRPPLYQRLNLHLL